MRKRERQIPSHRKLALYIRKNFINFQFQKIEILESALQAISKSALQPIPKLYSTMKLNRLPHKSAFTLSPNSFMIQEEMKTYKLTFNLVSSPVNVSFNFSRVFNFDFSFRKHKDSVTYRSPANMRNKTNLARNEKPR